MDSISSRYVASNFIFNFNIEDPFFEASVWIEPSIIDVDFPQMRHSICGYLDFPIWIIQRIFENDVLDLNWDHCISHWMEKALQ